MNNGLIFSMPVLGTSNVTTKKKNGDKIVLLTKPLGLLYRVNLLAEVPTATASIYYLTAALLLDEQN
ncbi:hypothetical protein C5O19_13085 [Siphonobacter curvatus]|uniref:Uncharacterized protein n=1 Tax=Siphonobacter curvatus TaxID=2094562 RepID=A0A2S7IS96_9BACT|nr:hypothetical protein C5O19_13085 [Siphonobacter curvatus]